VIDRQGRDEAGAFRSYREITADSLVDELAIDARAADRIGAELGAWPLFADSPAGLAALQTIAPCAAITNSDLAHRSAVSRSLGFDLAHWFCAEELRRYKPAPEIWHEVARRLGTPLDRAWWHVSAYADYDLDVGRALGLTTVLVTRPHHRPGKADHTVTDLHALASLVAHSAS
jgi:2-haloacid dehalogenase